MISAPGVGPDGAEKVSQPGDMMLGPLPMSNGNHLWVQVRKTKLTGNEIQTFAKIGQDHFTGAFNGDPGFAMASWVTTDPDHAVPLIVTFPLDRRIHFGQVDG
jgi:hypothetical protein